MNTVYVKIRYFKYVWIILHDFSFVKFLINSSYSGFKRVRKKTFHVEIFPRALSYLLIMTKGSLLHSVLLRAL